jgi:hypothetical protein
MKQLMIVLMVLILISGSVFGKNSGQKGRNGENTFLSKDLVSNLPKEELSQAEIDGILLMREEEKLARDVYQALYQKWGLQIFDNISLSEQSHTEAIKGLIDRYSIPDPMANDVPGRFENQELQRLYDELVAQGSASLVDALQVGATVEDLDIFDLENLLQDADNQDVRIVFLNLIKGSRNHLRSFASQLSKNGSSYEAQYISRDYLSRILESSQETGSIQDPWFQF